MPLHPVITNPNPEKELTIDSVNALFRDYICEFLKLSGDRVLIETRMDRRPIDGLYVTLWWKRQEPLMQVASDADFSYNEETGTATNYLPNETYATLQITCRGPNAYNVCSELRYSLYDPARYFDLFRVIGFGGAGTVEDLSASYGGRIQQRAFIDVSFYCCFGRSYPADWFDKSQWAINNGPIFTINAGDKDACNCLPS